MYMYKSHLNSILSSMSIQFSLISLLFTLHILLTITSDSIASNPNLQWLSFYDFNPDVQHGWSFGVSSDLNSINQAYISYKMQSLYGDLPDCSGCGTGVIDRSHKTLDPNWQSNLEAIVQQVAPFITNNTILGYFIGDEICCAGVPYSNLTSVSNYLRQLVGISNPNNNVIIYTNECTNPIENEWPTIIPSLNWISVDIYNYHNGTLEFDEAYKWYHEYMYPKLNNSQNEQKVLFVPGIFACNTSTVQFDSQQIVNKLDLFFNWAKNDSLVAGMNPWHFNNRSSQQHDPPCTMQIGAIDMPDVVDKLKQIGYYIMANINNTQSKQL